MKRDIILLISILVIGALGIVVTRAFFSEDGAEVVITIDGSEYGRYSLYSPREIVVDSEYGTNTVVINNGKVDVIDADCPDKICVNHVPVTYNHETIVCLPHKLVVEVKSSMEQAVDAISGK